MPKCPGCEYDLTGSPVAEGMIVCPECGRSVNPRAAVPRPPFPKAALIGAVIPWGLHIVLGIVVFPIISQGEVSPDRVWLLARVMCGASFALAIVAGAVRWSVSTRHHFAVLLLLVLMANTIGIACSYMLCELLGTAGC